MRSTSQGMTRVETTVTTTRYQAGASLSAVSCTSQVSTKGEKPLKTATTTL